MELKRLTHMELNQRQLYINKVRAFLKNVVLDYPLHNFWYEQITLSSELAVEREILVVVSNNNILGVSILKDNFSEKKVCTLKVDESYRHQGVGKLLLSASMEMLNTDKPLISVSDRRRNEFKGLFDYFGYQNECVYINKYRIGHIEYVYNGILRPETILNRNNVCSCKNIALA